MKALNAYFILFLLASASLASYAQSGSELNLTYGLNKPNLVEIYPNPTVDFLTVTIQNSNLENPKIEIFNIIGSAIEVDVEKKADNQFTLNVKNLPAGYYLVSIKDNGIPIMDMFKFLKR